MPKLIEIDAPQALSQPRETAASQGADQAAALGQIGKGSEYIGRAVMSYQTSTAKNAATEYRLQLRNMQRDVEQKYDLDQRSEQFENRLPAVRERVLGEFKFASKNVFDRDARIYEGDYRYSLGENVQQERLQRGYSELQQFASTNSVLMSDQTEFDGASLVFSEFSNRINEELDSNDITAAQARQLKSTTLAGAIQNIQDENPAMANQLLKKYASLLTPAQYADFDNSISASTDINASLLAAETVFTENPNATVPELRSAIGELGLTPSQRKDATAQVRQMVSDRETAVARNRAKSSVSLVQGTHEQDWSSYSPVQKATLMGEIRKNKDASPEAVATSLRIATAEGKVVTDQALWARLWSNPELMGTPGLAYSDVADRIQPSEWQGLEKRRASMLSGNLNESLVDSVLKRNFDRFSIEDDLQVGSIGLQVIARLRGTTPTADNVQEAFDQIYRLGQRYDKPVLPFAPGRGNEFEGVSEGVIAEATESFPDLVSLMRAANADLNEDQFAAQLDIALRRLNGMTPEAQRGKLLAIRAELERLTAPPPLPVAAPPPTANAPTRMSQPPGSVRIGAEDAFEPLPLPSGFNEFDDSPLDGLS
jgi:hypothetical protein